MDHVPGSEGVKILQTEWSIESLISGVLKERDEQIKEDAFVVFDLGDIVKKWNHWKTALPRVHPHYAMKANDDPRVLKLIADLGLSFDCASKGEIEKILGLGVSPSRIIYANPVKQKSYIRYADTENVHLMTFDSDCELKKIKMEFPEAKLVLRILPPLFKATSLLGKKFGCPQKDVKQLLEYAKVLQLKVVGISFHVGSGCMEAKAFSAAIKQAREAYDIGKTLGFEMELLDIGGGFPGHDDGLATFEEICAEVKAALQTYFPEDSKIRIIAEPGRYFVSSSVTLVVNVIGRTGSFNQDHNDADRQTSSDERTVKYYINESIYGVFNTILYGKPTLKPTILKVKSEKENGQKFISSIWGPTCDSIDLIMERCTLPKLEIGDWMYFRNLGAYALSACSTFNGFPYIHRIYLCEQETWKAVYGEES